jgi:hypothetical protein
MTKIEIEQEIERRLKDFQGYISKDAIIFLIAKDKGFESYKNNSLLSKQKNLFDVNNYDDLTMKSSEINTEQTDIILLGVIENIYGINHYTHKDGTPGMYGSFIFNDGSNKIKILIWGEQANIIKSQYFRNNEIIRIIGGFSKFNQNGDLEVHLSNNGKIIFAPIDANLEKFPLLIKKIQNMKKGLEKPSCIKNLVNFHGFIKEIKGSIARIDFFQEIDLKNGEKSFLLKFTLNDDSSSISVNIWGMKAVNYFKNLRKGDKIKLENVLVKNNSYTNEKEIIFTKYSRLIKF